MNTKIGAKLNYMLDELKLNHRNGNWQSAPRGRLQRPVFTPKDTKYKAVQTWEDLRCFMTFEFGGIPI